MTVPDAAPRTLTLHAVRLLGFADDEVVARRFRQPLAEVGEELLDLERLTSVGRRVQPLQRDLSDVDPRFDGYAERYAAALERARHGSPPWVDGVGLDSCHVAWMQLHEDLLATLGLTRGDEG